jgi:hypothetical protein
MSDIKLPGKITIAKLQAMSAKERENLWVTARRHDTEEAQNLVSVIETLGLPYSEHGGMKMDSPIAIKMYEIINSSEGRDACLEATKAGLPALAGVDQLLSEALGVDYHAGNQATHTAGYIVGSLMISLGYELSGRKKMPPGSVAKVAATWTPRNS